MPTSVVYNTMQIQNCYSNRVYLHSYIYIVTCSFLFNILNHSFSLSLSLSLQSIEKGEEEEVEEINSNKFKNSSQIELKITQNKIQWKTYLNKPNQPKTHVEATVAAAMEAWVECLSPP